MLQCVSSVGILTVGTSWLHICEHIFIACTCMYPFVWPPLWDSQSFVLYRFFLSEAIVVHKAVWTSESLTRAVGEEWSVFNLILFAEGKTDSSQDPVEGADIFGKWWLMFCSANVGITLLHYMLQRINLCQLKNPILFVFAIKFKQKNPTKKTHKKLIWFFSWEKKCVFHYFIFQISLCRNIYIFTNVYK